MARRIFTTTAGVLTALVLSLPATAAAQGFVEQRSASQNQYEPPPNPPPGHGGTPPGQGGTPPGQGTPKPDKPQGDKKGTGNVKGNDNDGKDGAGTLGDGDVGGAGGSGGGSVLGANTTGSLERSGSLPFTGLEIWMLLVLGLAAIGAGVATRRASRSPLA